MKLTQKEANVLGQLRANWESDTVDGWGMVYLDNLEASNEIGFAGILGSLTKKGLYRESGFAFGEVKLELTLTKQVEIDLASGEWVEA